MAKLFRGSISPDGLNGHARGTLSEALGIVVTEVGEDYVRAEMAIEAATRQPFGLLHGGASAALAETVGSIAGNLCLDPEREAAVGVELNANHLRACRQGKVTATARPLRVGRRLHVWEIHILDDRERLVCVSRLTLSVVPRGAV